MRRITYCLCTILRKNRRPSSFRYTRWVSHMRPHHCPTFNVINESLQDLPKNLNLILSPHHIRFFFFLFRCRIVPASPNPDGAHTHSSRELRERFYVCERERKITTLPRTGLCARDICAQAATEDK